MSGIASLIRPYAGGLITEPGAYSGLDINLYHGNPVDGVSVSSTGLRKIRNQSPAHYFANSYLNPARKAEDQKGHFNLGQAAHMLFLGEEGFTDTFILRPDEYPDRKTGELKPWHGGATYCKEWAADAAASGKRVLTSDQVEAIRGMSQSLSAHPVVQKGILNGLIETSLIWKDPETGVWLKSRPDVLPTDTDVVSDLKTSQDVHPSLLSKTVSNWGYHMQLALVGMGLRETVGLTIPDDSYVLVFVETEEPYATSVIQIDPEAIYWGRREIRAALRTFADCLSKGHWPAYGEDVRVVGLTQRYRERLEAEAEAGLLPADY